MQWGYIEANWKQVKGRVRERWGQLTDDDLERIAGKRDRLLGVLQERYTETRENLEKQIEEWREKQKAPSS